MAANATPTLPESDFNQLFAERYVIDLNAAETYHSLRPDVTYESAKCLGSKKLKDPQVAKLVRDMLEEKKKQYRIEAGTILDTVSTAAQADITELMDEDGEFDLMKIKNAPPELRRCIESIEVTDDIVKTAGERSVIKRKVKIKMKDGLRAAQLLGQNQKLWNEGKTEVEHKGEVVHRVVIDDEDCPMPEAAKTARMTDGNQDTTPQMA